VDVVIWRRNLFDSESSLRLFWIS